MGKRVSNILVMIGAFILVVLLFQIDIEKITYSQESVSNINFGEITLDNTVVEEIIVPVDTKVDDIEVKLATFGRINTNINTVDLYVNNEKLCTKQFESEKIIDDTYNQLFDNDLKLNLIAGDKVTIIITSEDASSGNAITVWADNTNEKGTLYTRNQKGNLTQIEGAINLRFSYDTTFIGWLMNKYQNHTLIIIFTILMFAIGILAFLKLCIDILVEVLEK